MQIFELVERHLEQAGRVAHATRRLDGRSVVTFEAVDAWHQSSIGCSWSFFDDFRVYFGDDDVLLWGGETYLTEAGYAKLAPKCFGDDLSWKVQSELTGVTGCADRPGEESTSSSSHQWPGVPDRLPDDLYR